MGDTANWEFAAAVAVVTIGLGGMLLFTVIGAIGSWRLLASAATAPDVAPEASPAAPASSNSAMPTSSLTEGASHLSNLRLQAETLLEQQSRLQDTFGRLVAAGVLEAEAPSVRLQDLDAAISDLDAKLDRVIAAVANLDQHT